MQAPAEVVGGSAIARLASVGFIGRRIFERIVGNFVDGLGCSFTVRCEFGQ